MNGRPTNSPQPNFLQLPIKISRIELQDNDGAAVRKTGQFLAGTLAP